MPQHFLLSPVARSLQDDKFIALINQNEPLAHALFKLHRWGSLTEQVCPRCGVVDAHMPRERHKQWRCRHCAHDFSLKSGSLFDGTKLPLWVIVKGIYLFVTNAKGRSAIEMSHKLNISYRAAYLLLHKIRWAFWATPPEEPLTGEFSIDVVWVLKGLRDPNDRSPEAKAARQTKRRERLVKRLVGEGMTEEQAVKVAKKEYPLTSEPRRSNPKKQCVLAIARHGAKGKGSSYVIGVPLPSENYAMVREALHRYVAKGSVIYSDSSAASTALRADYEVRRVNHDTHYKSPEGWHTNYVESAFARWRRMEIGTYHRMSPRRLHLYFAECGWRENHRRDTPMEKLNDALSRIGRLGPCSLFKKYQNHLSDQPGPRQIALRAAGTLKPTDLAGLTALLELDKSFEPQLAAFHQAA
ncbi:IS1595 family transposase [Burkholderia pseudomallei]|uniref:IS1595 family transposase n=1 Tax=Burkholderia pseudomallei TaxID=28450 RepID=UPI0021B47266|nr:IS1595 family transposase [Burkholderia pseudomallei]MCT7346501.1 IS1595 family transposase [Burkholderia pseudomallei]MCT7918067.1 IS1595 family transposase [Burkholderia pseudomallei]